MARKAPNSVQRFKEILQKKWSPRFDTEEIYPPVPARWWWPPTEQGFFLHLWFVFLVPPPEKIMQQHTATNLCCWKPFLLLQPMKLVGFLNLQLSESKELHGFRRKRMLVELSIVIASFWMEHRHVGSDRVRRNHFDVWQDGCWWMCWERSIFWAVLIENGHWIWVNFCLEEETWLMDDREKPDEFWEGSTRQICEGYRVTRRLGFLSLTWLKLVPSKWWKRTWWLRGIPPKFREFVSENWIPTISQPNDII